MKVAIENEFTSVHGQLQIDGTAILTEDCEMRNTANDGKDGLRDKWVEPGWYTAKAGDTVRYHMQETRTGFYHTVTLTNETGTFAATKKTETFRGRMPA